ncbi:MAG: class I adenylate cyclase [Thermodesulfobacteriota bacterium]
MKLLDKLLGRKSAAESLDSKSGEPTAKPEDRNTAAEEETRLVQVNKVFERYNANKTAFLYELLPPRKRIVFDLVPLLIHLDSTGLINCDDACRISPHGVYGYEPGPNTAKSFAEAFPGREMPKLRSRGGLDPSLPVKTIALIGSLGSIAQNNKSDFDYWVCFDEDIFSRESLIYFKEKLRAIEKWAEAFAGAEVHFFPLDMDSIRQDDFGPVSGESSGTALGKLLKEEFYRSLTLVTGQAPLWWVMPPGIRNEEYQRLAEIVSRSSRIEGTRLVDMGNVHNISLGEFYGAAIWQINKTMGSPFKSVLKMALLEEYMINRGKKGLLCAELKERLLADEEAIGFLDPYVLMFERAGAYLTEQDRLDDLDLLRRAMYMKSGAMLTLADYRRTDLPRKKMVMVKLVRSWGWNHKTVEHFNNFHNWSFRQSLKFSQETNQFLALAYRNIIAELNQQKEQVGPTISQRDLNVLGRKLYIYYSKRTNKVDSIKSVIEAPPALNGVTLQPSLDQDDRRVWVAFRGLLSWESVISGLGNKDMLVTTDTLSHALIWLINNQLYDTHTSVLLNSNEGRLKTYCTVPDLHQLLKALKAFFPPYKHSEVDEQELLSKPRLVRMFLVANLEENDRTGRLVQADLGYQNSWGEIFHKSFKDPQEGLKVAQDFVRKHFAFDPLGALSNFKVFLPERQFKKDLREKLNKYFGMKAVI